MSEIKIGDVVCRKSYGGDNPFLVSKIVKREDGGSVCVLKGILYRIEADAHFDDLVQQDRNIIYSRVYRDVMETRRTAAFRSGIRILSLFERLRSRPGRILHIDSSGEFTDMCLKSYRESGIRAAGHVISESEQPEVVKGLLNRYQPDILVLTGHDGLKKNASTNSIDSYNNSRYFIKSVREARKYQPSKEKLCIFAGACQSYFEAIMAEGANFASSPGRILIHALDPSTVCEKVALTDSTKMIFPKDVVQLTKSGAKGIGGIETRGHLNMF